MEKEVHFKYLIVNEHDLDWGMTVDTVGHQKILPHSTYPPDNHPKKFLFSNENGRVLDEYQLLYITNGEGSFISESKKQQVVKEGHMLLLFPGEWHNYRPVEPVGWNAYWIGFNGEIVDKQVQQGFFNKLNPIFKVGLNAEVVELYDQAIKIATEQKAGYQQILAGIVNHLLGLAYSLAKNYMLEDLKVENQINKAKIIIVENLYTGIKATEIADKINMSYSWFRQVFKEYTGFAPVQYMQELKIQKAKELLVNTSLSVKEIAYKMGFENHEYFFTTFKRKTRMTPIQYRRLNQEF